MIVIKPVGSKLMVFLILSVLFSCAVKDKINIQSDNLIYLDIPKQGIKINYYRDYAIDNSIDKKEKRKVFKQLDRLTRIKGKHRLVYRAKTKLPPFFNEYLIQLDNETFVSMSKDSQTISNTLFYLFKNKRGDAFVLIHTWEHDSEEIRKAAKSEFDAITSTIRIE